VILIESVATLKSQHHDDKLEDIFIELVEDEQKKETE